MRLMRCHAVMTLKWWIDLGGRERRSGGGLLHDHGGQVLGARHDQRKEGYGCAVGPSLGGEAEVLTQRKTWQENHSYSERHCDHEWHRELYRDCDCLGYPEYSDRDWSWLRLWLHLREALSLGTAL